MLITLNSIKKIFNTQVKEPRLNSFADINFQVVVAEACISHIYGKHKESIPNEEMYKIDPETKKSYVDESFVNSYMQNKLNGDSFYQSISTALQDVNLPKNIYKPSPEESATFVTQAHNIKTLLGLVDGYKKTLDPKELGELEGKIRKNQKHADNIHNVSRYSYQTSPEGAGGGKVVA